MGARGGGLTCQVLQVKQGPPPSAPQEGSRECPRTLPAVCVPSLEPAWGAGAQGCAPGPESSGPRTPDLLRPGVGHAAGLDATQPDGPFLAGLLCSCSETPCGFCCPGCVTSSFRIYFCPRLFFFSSSGSAPHLVRAVVRRNPSAVAACPSAAAAWLGVQAVLPSFGSTGCLPRPAWACSVCQHSPAAGLLPFCGRVCS